MTKNEFLLGAGITAGLLNVATGISDHGYQSLDHMIFGTQEVMGYTQTPPGNIDLPSLLPAAHIAVPLTQEQLITGGIEATTAAIVLSLISYSAVRLLRQRQEAMPRGRKVKHLTVIK